MNDPNDRRADEARPSEVLSPEYLAVLVVCGGTVRESDWEHLPESLAARRPAPRGADAAAGAVTSSR